MKTTCEQLFTNHVKTDKFQDQSANDKKDLKELNAECEKCNIFVFI